MSAYEAIIFDLGKVVFDLSFDRVFQYWAKASNKPFEELKNNFRFDGIFDAFERDEVAPEEFRAEISTRLAVALSSQEFDAGWCDLYLDTYRGIDALLAELQRKYQLVALTNTNRIHSAIWKTKYAGTLRYFRQVFSSHELRARKPEAKAYQAVLDYLRVAPQQAVFLDDNSENIAGAKKLGLTTILVTSPVQMTTELRALGLLH